MRQGLFWQIGRFYSEVHCPPQGGLWCQRDLPWQCKGAAGEVSSGLTGSGRFGLFSIQLQAPGAATQPVMAFFAGPLQDLLHGSSQAVE